MMVWIYIEDISLLKIGLCELSAKFSEISTRPNFTLNMNTTSILYKEYIGVEVETITVIPARQGIVKYR